MTLAKAILIKRKNFFTLINKTANLVKKNNKLIYRLSINRKTKKINFQLSRCFLKKKEASLLSSTKSHKIFYNLYLRNIATSAKKDHNVFLKQLYKKNINNLIKNHSLNSKNKTVEMKNRFINVTRSKKNPRISIQKNSNLKQKNYLLQAFKLYQPDDLPPLATLSLMQRSLNPTPVLAKKIKAKPNYVPPIFLQKNYLTKKNRHNNPLLEKLKDKTIVAFRKKNKNSFNSSMPITLSSQSQYHASKLIQNILCLNTTIKEAYSVASLAPRIQEDKRNDLIKLDKRLSHLQEIIEGFIQTKQNEMNNLTFNPFNEKRKKTYYDFL